MTYCEGCEDWVDENGCACKCEMELTENIGIPCDRRLNHNIPRSFKWGQMCRGCRETLQLFEEGYRQCMSCGNPTMTVSCCPPDYEDHIEDWNFHKDPSSIP